MKRDVWTVVLALLLTLLLAACGGKSVAGEGLDQLGSYAAETGDSAQEEQEDQTADEAEGQSGAVETAEEPSSGTLTQESLEDYPVTDESAFHAIADGDGMMITGCTSEDAVIVVPETINGAPVVSIDSYGFANMSMEGLVLPDTVQSIGSAAFFGCNQLKYVELGDGLRSIGAQAFNLCSSLESVSFSEGLEEICGYLFYQCDNLGEVYIPASVTSIPTGIGEPTTCPNAVVVTPAGSAAEAAAELDGLPVKTV